MNPFYRFLYTSAIRACAQDMARDFANACPLPTTIKQKIPESRVDASIVSLIETARSFVVKERLGVIRRAALGKAFQEEIQALGYPDEIATKITSALTINALVRTKPN
jgi:gamma-glutamylcysteine synthetase